MSRLLEAKQEERQARLNSEVLAAVEFELVGSIAHIGGVLTGFSVKFGVVDCLMTLRADFEDNSMVCFVGAPALPDCLRKAVVEGHGNRLRWKEDSYKQG